MDDYLTALYTGLRNLERRVTKLELLESVTAGALQSHVYPMPNDLGITNSFQDMPGTTVLLEPGRYVMFARLNYAGPNNSNDDGQNIRLACNVDGVDLPGVVESTIRYLDGVQALRNSISHAWDVEMSTPFTVKLRIAKSGGAGGTTALGSVSGLVVLGVKS